MRIARKHIAWYSKGQPEGSQFRQQINLAESADEQLRHVRDYFTMLIEQKALAA